MSKPSPVEVIKARSRRLRGTLLESLADPVTAGLREDDLVLMKFHGSYQQDNRDDREERRQAKLEPSYSFMIRTRTPGGVVTPAQWLQLDEVATRHAERGLRITTRQAFQFHGVLKGDLQAAMQGIFAAGLTTIAACGDVNRNVVSAANPLLSRAHAMLYADAALVSGHFLPRSRAWHETWLGEEPGPDSGTEDEPIYGERYLPRKFKIGFAIPPWNDIDVFAQDLGFIAILDGEGRIAGYNVLAGGGMGATHGDATTYPRLASVLGFVPHAQLIATAEGVVTAQRDHGNREERRYARLKYTIDRMGVDAFRTEVEQRGAFRFEPPRPFAFEHNGDRFGWVEGEDGLAHLTLRLPAGRIIDGVLDGRGEPVRHLSGLRAIAHLLGEHGGAGHFRMTANQNLVIAAIAPALREAVDAAVAGYGLGVWQDAGPLRQNAIACVALPTCGLAMAEAERYLPDFVTAVEGLLVRHGIPDANIHLRISGCPNGCPRPYLGEIALIGKAPGRYNLMLGADRRGQRLNTLYRENVVEAEILQALDPLLGAYASERQPDEDFGDFLLRTGVVEIPEGDTRVGIPVTVVEPVPA